MPQADAGGPIGRITAVLRRLATLHTELAQAFGELALAVDDEPSLMFTVNGGPHTQETNSTPTASSRLLSISDVAERLAVSTDTVRRWRRNKVLPPAIEVAGIVRWRVEAVENWIAEREKASP